MNHRRTCLVVLIVSLCPPVLAIGHPTLQAPSCQSKLSGAEFPDLVPDFFSWQAVFEEIQAEGDQHPIINPTSLGAQGHTLVLQRTAALRTHLAELRGKLAARESRIRDTESANAITEARDDLIRSLPTNSYRILKTAVDAAKRKAFSLPAPGSLVGLIPSGSGCRVTVRGRDYPHLIPDKFYWRFYFQTIAGAAKSFRRGPDDYDPKHIAAVRSSMPIPLPWQYITQLLETATQVVEDIERLPNNEEADAVADSIAEEARDQLIRVVPKPIWLAIKADVSRSRAGTIMTFPPSR